MNTTTQSKNTQGRFSGIVRLLFGRRPPAIFLAVMSIHINSINRGVFGSKLTHMFKVRFVHIIPEFLKGVPKTFNASSPVNIPSISFRAVASRLNVMECSPKFSAAHPMFSRSIPDRILERFKFATAASRLSSYNPFPIGNRFVSAIAFEQPIVPKSFIGTWYSMLKSYCDEPVEFLSSYVLSCSEYISTTPLIPSRASFRDSICKVFKTVWVHEYQLSIMT